MRTPPLFHGPEARDRAVNRATQQGRLISEPVGDKGLKVEDSRRVVEISLNPGVGDKPPYVVIGPLDAATPEASDALLKTLEEVQNTPLRIVLWADYLGEVIPTIRSRTHAVWCPPGRTWLDPLSWKEDAAKDLLKAWLAKDWPRVMGILQENSKDWQDLIRALCNLLPNYIQGEEDKIILLWGSLRETLDGKGSFLVALDALLPSDLELD
jgi:hypothetical protein